MQEKQEFALRLREGMRRAGYQPRPVVLEREFNTRYWGRPVTVQAVRRWLRGEAIPAQDKLLVLAQWLGLDPQVLRFGAVAHESMQKNRAFWEEGMDHQDRETFEVFLRLPVMQRKTAREVILALEKSCQLDRIG
ncbi:transcriptional regulator [Allofranklinella schreckenbergeri]|uniref:Transcriptional regulator n=1 Tax=Allofranklinella schreckenbergeri TaxID=1076744 RepID=A0A3M6QEY8_9BURK|nr:transcriptional regulator [Allofranklinella schreckenbergeri]RMX01670.1 transcriptional regulator [Allofranklinella schreckenbergeri]